MSLTTPKTQYPNLVDAVRERDGTQVMLKRVPLASEELPISLYVSSEPLTCDPRNRCVQVLDVILIPACETHIIIAMPLLYAHAHLLFRRVGEFVEIAEQLVDVSMKLQSSFLLYTLRLLMQLACSASTSYTTTISFIGEGPQGT